VKISVREMPFAFTRSGFSVTESVLPCQYTDTAQIYRYSANIQIQRKYTDTAQIYKKEMVLNFKLASKMSRQHECKGLLVS